MPRSCPGLHRLQGSNEIEHALDWQRVAESQHVAPDSSSDRPDISGSRRIDTGTNAEDTTVRFDIDCSFDMGWPSRTAAFAAKSITPTPRVSPVA